VAFTSYASNLVPIPPSDAVSSQVYVFDRQSHTVERVSVNAAGDPGNDSSRAPSLSADGRFVVFLSFATNLLGSSFPQSGQHVYLYDRQTHLTRRVDGPFGAGISSHPVISANGRYIAFSFQEPLGTRNINVFDTSFNDFVVYGVSALDVAADGDSSDPV